jgi:hypothetical protein
MKRLALSLFALALPLLFAPDAKAQFRYGLFPGSFVPGLVPGHFPHHLPGHIPGRLPGRFPHNHVSASLLFGLPGADLTLLRQRELARELALQNALLQQQALAGSRYYAPRAPLLLDPGPACPRGGAAALLRSYGAGAALDPGGVCPAGLPVTTGSQVQFFFSTRTGGY